MHKHDFARTTVWWQYDQLTGSLQYILVDKATRKAAIIDPVLDFDRRSARTSTENADSLLRCVADEALDVAWILDTHPHADHFSAACYLGEKLGAPRAIGEKVREVQKLWKDIYCLPDQPTDGAQWDRLFTDGESFMLGETEIRVLFSPGHTLASISYVTDEQAFVHDTLMMPDAGTSRADFPGGDAHELYRTIRTILDLPRETMLFVGHDYCPDGRDVACAATVAEHRESNKHVHDGVSEEDYVALREKRDATLPLPEQMLAALQVNIRGGRLPEPEACGRSFLKIPLDYFEPPKDD
ncbi:MBL fold metallo-hydrolase [Stakelama marina]|uniref:MBL fold metallo-hydrolase n=1 Tax=Stakelama marina TaxID=2826939 RepID=A0A8T4IE44_9SPHN|nr:MBL fold metallo-hydrolase [Stakelama marina]MBR0551255.1 MBL fold metallo-hydrolase [Stakelama marina]